MLAHGVAVHWVQGKVQLDYLNPWVFAACSLGLEITLLAKELINLAYECQEKVIRYYLPSS